MHVYIVFLPKPATANDCWIIAVQLAVPNVYFNLNHHIYYSTLSRLSSPCFIAVIKCHNQSNFGKDGLFWLMVLSIPRDREGAWHQGTGRGSDHIFTYIQKAEWTRDKRRLWIVNTYSQWCTWSNKSPRPKNSIPCPDSITDGGPKPMRSISIQTITVTNHLLFLFRSSSNWVLHSPHCKGSEWVQHWGQRISNAYLKIWHRFNN